MIVALLLRISDETIRQAEEPRARTTAVIGEATAVPRRDAVQARSKRVAR